MTPASTQGLWGWDPRLYQIAVLSTLLLYGVFRLDFEVRPAQAALILATVLLTQAAASRLARLPKVDLRSALISGLSLCLLLRTRSPALAVAVATFAVGSKFVLRLRGKHLLNPTNGALVLGLLLTPEVWVSPAQWGNAALFAFTMACLGGLVVNRAARSDVTYAFLGFWLLVQFGRAFALGDPLEIPIHRLSNGAFLLFTFFMISDPKTTPDSRLGRILFAGLVAAGAWYITFRLFRTNGLLYSLAGFSLLVPLIDRLLPGPRYAWSAAPAAAPEAPLGAEAARVAG
jgi:Na+-transporting NADH:ubiquinone oxidoreductase subunit NqrB